MSKAVTNEEVEDVLSSIRRLVSEDKRPLAGLRAAPSAAVAEPTGVADPETHDDADERTENIGEFGTQADAEDAAADAVPDRLVLTPALRVAEKSDPNDEAADQTGDDGPLDLGMVARKTWAPDQGDTDDVQDEATVEEAKAYKGPMMLFPAAQDSVAEEDRDAAMEALDALVHDALEAEEEPNGTPPASLSDDAALEDGDYSDEGYWDEDDGNAEPDYEQTGALSEDAVAAVAQEEAAEQEAPEQEDSVLSQSDADWDVDDALSDTDALEDEAVDEGAQDVVPDAKTTSSAAIPLTLKIAALETAVSKITAEWEPDGDERDALSTSDTAAMAWEDDIELDAKGAPFIVRPSVSEDTARSEMAQDEPAVDEPAADEAKVEQEAAPTAASAFAADDQLMDEEALRDLVSEIVRAELQGALGERITRNVRKLVRREIHRALTAQEME